jgi:hypothetical protein
MSHHQVKTSSPFKNKSKPGQVQWLTFIRPAIGKWMELENIILSEVSLAQKTKNRMFSLICGH